ncbi:hypothetical protein MUK42_14063 [Musa troglodytarum]|uniref:Uncharacterized protein n=1 Tax=Musa troglodytarum TaxID=320322 RepID=A0A9E7I3B5_9LILI|nr:hypothetical protein MUK42_14063 [Musa troglodytarum]
MNYNSRKGLNLRLFFSSESTRNKEEREDRDHYYEFPLSSLLRSNSRWIGIASRSGEFTADSIFLPSAAAWLATGVARKVGLQSPAMTTTTLLSQRDGGGGFAASPEDSSPSASAPPVPR